MTADTRYLVSRRLVQAQKSDYREDFDPTREQATEVIAHTRQFLAEANQVWESMNIEDSD